MNDSLRLAVIVASLFLFVVITYILKKGRMPIKYALVWYFSDLVVLLTAMHIDIYFNVYYDYVNNNSCRANYQNKNVNSRSVHIKKWSRKK